VAAENRDGFIRARVDLDVPFTDFAASGAVLCGEPRPETVKGLTALVYGQGHEAGPSFRAPGFN